MADSIRAEAQAKNIRLEERRPGYDLGLAMCILNCCFFIPVLNIFAALGALVCWIVYWIKIAEYKKRLQVTMFNYPQGETSQFSRNVSL